MHGNILYGTREAPPLALGYGCPRSARRTHKGAVMHDGGESDSLIVPEKQPNNREHGPGWVAMVIPTRARRWKRRRQPRVSLRFLCLGHGEMAEVAEERGLAKGNLGGCNRDRTQCRDTLQQALDRVRQAARRVKEPCTTPVRYYLKQEPGAVIPHAGICGGGVPGNRHPTATIKTRCFWSTQ